MVLLSLLKRALKPHSADLLPLTAQFDPKEEKLTAHSTTMATNTPPDLPPLHTAHLTPSQQAHLALNPTYTHHLRTLQSLATEIHRLKENIHARAIGKLPTLPDVSGRGSLDRAQGERDGLERLREECRALEERLWRWDDELVELAEGLLGRPRFGVGEEVVWREGAWWWKLPGG